MNSKLNRKFVPIFALLILILVSLACGGSEPETPEPAADTPVSAATQTPPTKTPAPPTPTPVPPTSTPEPVAEPGWYMYTNGNYVREIAVQDGFLWAATGGGVIAWDMSSDDIFSYTTLDGLPTNDVEAIVACPIPEPSIIAGTEYGLSIYDLDTDTLELMTTDNSGMERNDVDTLDCDPDNNLLMVGYTWGLDVFDASADEWLFLDEDDGLVTDWVSQAAIIGD